MVEKIFKGEKNIQIVQNSKKVESISVQYFLYFKKKTKSKKFCFRLTAQNIL